MTTLFLCNISHEVKPKNGLQKDVRALVQSLYRSVFSEDEVMALFRRLESYVGELNGRHSRCAPESVRLHHAISGDYCFYLGNLPNAVCTLTFLKFTNKN